MQGQIGDMEPIYLDNNASTRPAPEVISAVAAALERQYANPSSIHLMGQAARHDVEVARSRVAKLIGAAPREIIFTSGGTEADNLAILGILEANPPKRHLVTSAVEHPAVHAACERRAGSAVRTTYVPVDAEGHLDLRQLENDLTDDTALASIMHANNETGVIFPVPEIARISASRGIPLHVDAAQTVGRVSVNVDDLGLQLMTISAHKMHGPKGAGALYVRRGTRLRGRQVGGHQERDLRPGTENMPAIVGFGVAADLAAERLADDVPSRIADLRNRFEEGILQRVKFARVIGDPDQRICNTTNLAFEALSAEALLVGLSQRGLCASSGSACSSGSLEPSHVLAAMGIDRRLAHGAVRFSLSHESTADEIDRAIPVVVDVVEQLAKLRPLE